MTLRQTAQVSTNRDLDQTARPVRTVANGPGEPSGQKKTTICNTPFAALCVKLGDATGDPRPRVTPVNQVQNHDHTATAAAHPLHPPRSHHTTPNPAVGIGTAHSAENANATAVPPLHRHPAAPALQASLDKDTAVVLHAVLPTPNEGAVGTARHVHPKTAIVEEEDIIEALQRIQPADTKTEDHTR